MSDEMEQRTEINVGALAWEWKEGMKVLCLGSCFAEEVGKRMREEAEGRNEDGRTEVTVNPFGPLFNPESIACALNLLMKTREEQRKAIEESIFRQPNEGDWHSWYFSTKFTSRSMSKEGEVMSRESYCDRLCTIVAAIEKPDVLIITLGTTHAYRWKEDGRVVANCHRMPASGFEEREETGEHLREAIERYAREYGTKTIATVSPYRYKKYGLHASQIAKAKLLLWCDEWEQTGLVSYFPAYEIVLDELRDYRYYADDLVHPSEEAIDIVYSKFKIFCKKSGKNLHI